MTIFVVTVVQMVKRSVFCGIGTLFMICGILSSMCESRVFAKFNFAHTFGPVTLRTIDPLELVPLRVSYP